MGKKWDSSMQKIGVTPCGITPTIDYRVAYASLARFSRSAFALPRRRYR